MEANEIIIRPLLTEKSYAGIQNKIYSFVVDKRANKVQIAQAVELAFPGRKVTKVNRKQKNPINNICNCINNVCNTINNIHDKQWNSVKL